MEAEDESTGYLKLFNEGPNNYLLQSNEDALNDSFSVESIFTDWSAESFPILLSGPLVADGICVVCLKMTHVIHYGCSE